MDRWGWLGRVEASGFGEQKAPLSSSFGDVEDGTPDAFPPAAKFVPVYRLYLLCTPPLLVTARSHVVVQPTHTQKHSNPQASHFLLHVWYVRIRRLPFGGGGGGAYQEEWCSSSKAQLARRRSMRPTPHTGKESLTTLAEKVDLKGQRVFVRVDFNGAFGSCAWVGFRSR